MEIQWNGLIVIPMWSLQKVTPGFMVCTHMLFELTTITTLYDVITFFKSITNVFYYSWGYDCSMLVSFTWFALYLFYARTKTIYCIANILSVVEYTAPLMNLIFYNCSKLDKGNYNCRSMLNHSIKATVTIEGMNLYSWLQLLNI